MKKPPVKPKGGTAGGGASGKRGVGVGKSRGIKVHHRGVHSVPGRGLKASGGTGSGGGPVKAPHPHHVKKAAKPPKRRKWSPGSDVACCSAEALGLLLGWTPDQVLEFYWRTADDADEGASIADTLTVLRGDWSAFETDCPAALSHPMGSRGVPLILGVTLPEPHAIAVTIDGTWWSWGEPFDPADWPELVMDEAWQLCAG
jgi:hypothetical protein